MCFFHAETLSVYPIPILAVTVELSVTVKPKLAASKALIPPEALNPTVLRRIFHLKMSSTHYRLIYKGLSHSMEYDIGKTARWS